jgi:hypothetical protein
MKLMLRLRILEEAETKMWPRTFENKNDSHGAEGRAQVQGHLSSKCEALSSNLSTTPNKRAKTFQLKTYWCRPVMPAAWKVEGRRISVRSMSTN